MKRWYLVMLMVIGFTTLYAEDGNIKISGDFDGDVWYDFQTGESYNSHDLGVTITKEFSEDVKVNLAISATTEDTAGEAIYPPVGLVTSNQRWTNIAFDGAWLEFNLVGLSWIVGDLAYQFGTFNYYYYKLRKSVITPEQYVRGIQINKMVYDSLDLGFFIGALDDEKGSREGGLILTYKNTTEKDFKIESQTIFTLKKIDFDTIINAGVEFKVKKNFFDLKFDLGYMKKSDSSGLNFLVESNFDFDKYYISTSVYKKLDDDKVLDFIPDEDYFIYVEPGYKINGNFTIGLPLEYHKYDLVSNYWIVPTLYITPKEDVECWLWAQAVLDKDTKDKTYYIGSEIIFNF